MESNRAPCRCGSKNRSNSIQLSATHSIFRIIEWNLIKIRQPTLIEFQVADDHSEKKNSISAVIALACCVFPQSLSLSIHASLSAAIVCQNDLKLVSQKCQKLLNVLCHSRNRNFSLCSVRVFGPLLWLWRNAIHRVYEEWRKKKVSKHKTNTYNGYEKHKIMTEWYHLADIK